MSIRYLDDYEGQCKRCKGECGVEGMSGSIVCHGFVPMTNADRIRAMTDIELAKALSKIHGTCEWCPLHEDCDGENCDAALFEWLKEDVADKDGAE